jgi:two-component system chemotaxis response regulator CheY
MIADRRRRSSPGRAGARAVNPIPPRRILLVEDDEDTRQLLAVALEGQAYAVEQAADAEKGLKALRAGRFDLVLTDYDLPGKTGAAMLREAQAAALLGGAATLVVTAHPDPEGVEETPLVRKPLDLGKFLLQVRSIFDSGPPRATRAADRSGAGATAPEKVEEERIELRLYVSPSSAPSMKARRNMEKLLRDFRPARILFEVFDLSREAERAEEDKVVFTPTLVKRGPEPRAWIVGDLSDPRVVTDLLHMCGIEPISAG